MKLSPVVPLLVLLVPLLDAAPTSDEEAPRRHLRGGYWGGPLKDVKPEWVKWMSKHCENKECPALECADDKLAVLSRRECCPVCKPKEELPKKGEKRCEKVQCPAVQCADDELAVFFRRGCCPVCMPNGGIIDLLSEDEGEEGSGEEEEKQGSGEDEDEGEDDEEGSGEDKEKEKDPPKCPHLDCNPEYEEARTVEGDSCPTCQLKPNCQKVECLADPCTPICGEEEDLPKCPHLDCKEYEQERIVEGDDCPTCQPAPCDMMSCTDACYDWETDSKKCKDNEICVTEKILHSGGGPHCPDIGCPHFVECKEEECTQLDCKPGYEARTVEGDNCPTCQPIPTSPDEPEPCWQMSCTDPCYDWETDSKKCKDNEMCVTETILHSGGGPHCPDTGCSHFVECKEEECLQLNCKPGYAARTVEGDNCPTCQPIPTSPDEPEPCWQMSCTDPCYDWETDSKKCKDNEMCVTETILHSGGGPHCPDTGCSHFVECKEEECLQLNCKPGYAARTVEGDNCPTCQPIPTSPDEPEPCWQMSCTDPCYDWETDSKKCKDNEMCVTETILHSGGGPHCPDTGCSHFVECKEEECLQLNCKPGYAARTVEGDNCPTCQPIPTSPDEPEPCWHMDCFSDPCYNYEADMPFCKDGQKCLTETIYQSGGGPDCPKTGCPRWVGCE